MKECPLFLKWPGGKRWIISHIKKILDKETIANYYEPFLGGGAVFFSSDFQNAILSDTNSELINAYNEVKENPNLVIDGLKKLSSDKETYYCIRKMQYSNPLEKAVQFIYLNRLAFGGMYRVNKDGKFNVPYGGDGRTIDLLWEKKLIENASNKLQKASLISEDFELLLSKAEYGDLVYCDPPYTVLHNINGFQRYNEKIFEWEDQIRLVEACRQASKRGVKIIVSNAAHESIKKLYLPNTPLIISRYSGLSRRLESRQQVEEFLFFYNIPNNQVESVQRVK